jgi:hypothetical protein
MAVAVPVRALVRSTPSTTKRFSEPEAPSIIKPPPRASLLVPGICVRTLSRPRPFGIKSINSESTLAVTAFALTSMIGDSAVTETVSVRPPSFMTNRWRAACRASRPHRRPTPTNPWRVAVTWYVPAAAREIGSCPGRR